MSSERPKTILRGVEHAEEADDLKKQFLEKHTLSLEEKETLEYTLVRPENESEQTEWVVVIGGFSSTKEMWKEEVLDLAQSGKRVVFVTPDKGITPNADESSYFEEDGHHLPHNGSGQRQNSLYLELCERIRARVH